MRRFLLAALAATLFVGAASVAFGHTSAPTGLVLTGSTETSVSLDWQQDYGDSYDGYYVRVDDGARMRYSSSQGTVGGLRAGTSYRFCVTIDLSAADHADESDKACLVSTTKGATPTPAPTPTPTPTPDPITKTVTIAGDIAGAASGTNDDSTAALVERLNPDVALTAGDQAYEDGSASEFDAYYHPTWGRFKGKTRPTAGNHEYHLSGAGPYFDYFGAAAGVRGKGWYSFNVGSWHLVSLNSNLSMSSSSEQITWLKADLAANAGRCTMAYWHRPRWTSGSSHSSSTTPAAAIQALYNVGADLVVTGHNHQYERFAPMNPSGARDDLKGIRTFVVGTGGAGLYGFGTVQPNSEVRNNDTYGVLRLSLREGAYDWRFERAAGGTFIDAGSNTCHNASAPG